MLHLVPGDPAEQMLGEMAVDKSAVQNLRQQLGLNDPLHVQYGRFLVGTVVIETVFARPGIGRLIVDSILKKDFPVVQGTVLLSAIFYVTINLLVDLSYALVDPRIRYQ